MPLKVVTINIEGQRHLERVLPFLQREQPDVVCVQELYGVDVARFERELGMKTTFVPLVRMEADNDYGFPKLGLFGIGLFVKAELAQSDVRVDFYRGSAQTVQVFGPPNSLARAVVSALIMKDGLAYRIGTTHFTWSPGGEVIPEQRVDLRALLAVLQTYDDLVLCGDFNAPRGRDIYEEAVAAGLRDWLPPEITTTLDPHLHYAGKLDLVVDYLFTWGKTYSVRAARAVSGVSDHQGLVGEVERAG